MARKYELSTGSGIYAWNFAWVEEIIIIAGYCEIHSRISPVEKAWQNEFELQFFDIGNGLTFASLSTLNSIRHRYQLPSLTFEETDIDEYGKTPDKSGKAQHRRRFRDEFGQLGQKEREKIVADARLSMEQFPPPHRTYEEYKTERQGYLDTMERTRRERALQQAEQDKKQTAQDEKLKRALKMLQLASGAELREKILTRLSPEDALVLAEQVVDDEELRDMLVLHSLGEEE